jgi:hypothetical protein
MYAHDEPSTEGLLLNRLTAKETRCLFPKQVSKKMATALTNLANRMGAAGARPPGKNKTDELAKLDREFDTIQNSMKGGVLVGRRADGSFTSFFGKTAIFDVTYAHSTAWSHIAAELEATRRRIAELQLSRAEGRAPHHESGKTCGQRQSEKHATYSPLLIMLQKQVLDKLRTDGPIQFFGAANAGGELSLEYIALQEFLVASYAESLRGQPPRADGTSVAALVAAFRNRFRYGTLIAYCKGTVRILNDAGLPMFSTRKGPTAQRIKPMAKRPLGRAAAAPPPRPREDGGDAVNGGGGGEGVSDGMDGGVLHPLTPTGGGGV